jgi:hypothetical protein
MMVGILALLFLMQSPEAPAPQGQIRPAPGTSDVSVDRIRRQLQKPRVFSDDRLAVVSKDTSDGVRPLFRVAVTGYELRLPPPWIPQGAAPYIRPQQPLEHYEFLMAVTPLAFRSATLFPIGIPGAPLVSQSTSAVKSAIRHREIRQARAEVQEALRLWYEEHAKDKR